MRKTLILGMLLGAGFVQADAPPLETVPHVEIQKYLGDWYEQARLPNGFQQGCDQAQANYSLKPDGSLKVVNTCVKPDGATKQVEGTAEVIDKTTNSKLEVCFVPGWIRWTGVGRGKYWIIELHPKYEYAVVSEPDRKYLWILSRAKQMDAKTYAGILERLRAKGFDTTKFIERGKPAPN